MVEAVGTDADVTYPVATATLAAVEMAATTAPYALIQQAWAPVQTKMHSTVRQADKAALRTKAAAVERVSPSGLVEDQAVRLIGTAVLPDRAVEPEGLNVASLRNKVAAAAEHSDPLDWMAEFGGASTLADTRTEMASLSH